MSSAGRPVVELVDVHKYFTVGGLLAKKTIRAVDGVSVAINEGESLGVVGESGSGKSTLGRLSLRLYRPDRGKVVFMGLDITHSPEARLRKLRRMMQLIPQDPFATFNPLKTIGEAIMEPLIVHGILEGREAREEVYRALESVGLTPPQEFFDKKPYQLSGGQLQRAAIARAMILKPKYVVADEPTSNLDVSLRASIIYLLRDFKIRMGQAMMFITHDLAIAKLISDRIIVMYMGKVIEEGETREVLRRPLHPYTAALITAAPSISRKRRSMRVRLSGEIADPSNPPRGCRLHPRCPFARDKCRTEAPRLEDAGGGHKVACHYPLA